MKVQPHSGNSIENAQKGNPILVSPAMKMRPHPAAHPQ